MHLQEHLRINLSIAVPVMISQLGHILVGVADSIMVGHLGTIPLAGVALGNSVFGIFMVFGLGMSFGLTPLIARAQGRKHRHIQGHLLGHSFKVNMLVGLLLAACVLLMIPLLPVMGQERVVVSQASSYLVIVGLSLLPLMAFMTFKQYAEGFEDTRAAMYISLASNILNVGLNYLLIFGFWGIPQLGITGAALATLFSRVLMAVGMWCYVRMHRRYERWPVQWRNYPRRRKVTWKLVNMGFPMGLQYIFEVSAFALAAILAGLISASALAAHQVAINIASVSYMAVTGLGAAAAVRVGNQTARRDSNNLRMASLSIFSMAAIWMASAGCVIWFSRFWLAGLYSSDPEVLALATSMLVVAVIFQLSDGMQAVALGALRGFTDVRVPTLITFVAYWMVALPGAYLLSQKTELGALGIWYALAGGLTISAALLLYRFFHLLHSFKLKYNP